MKEVGAIMPTERPLKIDVRREKDLAVVKVSGSAGMDVSAELNQRLVTLAQDPIRLMVIDMSDLDFMCSEGLGAIVAAHLKCSHRGGRICLAAVTPPIREMLDVTNLSKLFPSFPTVDDAIKA